MATRMLIITFVASVLLGASIPTANAGTAIPLCGVKCEVGCTDPVQCQDCCDKDPKCGVKKAKEECYSRCDVAC